ARSRLIGLRIVSDQSPAVVVPLRRRPRNPRFVLVSVLSASCPVKERSARAGLGAAWSPAPASRRLRGITDTTGTARARPSPRADRSTDRLLDRRRLRLDGEPAGPGGGAERLIVPFDLVRVSQRILGHRLVEHAGRPQIAGQRRGIPRLGVG